MCPNCGKAVSLIPMNIDEVCSLRYDEKLGLSVIFKRKTNAINESKVQFNLESLTICNRILLTPSIFQAHHKLE